MIRLKHYKHDSTKQEIYCDENFMAPMGWTFVRTGYFITPQQLDEIRRHAFEAGRRYGRAVGPLGEEFDLSFANYLASLKENKND